jgi:phage FluMu protein Com
MSILNHLFVEKCPTCKENLAVNKTNPLSTQVIKSCPNGHYEKEFHPALESYIETVKS